MGVGGWRQWGRWPGFPEGVCVMSAVVEERVVNGEVVPGIEVLPGALVDVDTPAGLVRGLWLAGDDGWVVLVDDAGVVSKVQGSAVVVALEPLGGVVGRLAGACAAMFASRVEMEREHCRWVDRLVEVAHAAADQRDWCSDFDDLMESMGLPRRRREYEVEVGFSGSVRVDVLAGSSDEAEDSVDESQVLAAMLTALNGAWLSVSLNSVDAC